jgi:hypothetical protein
MCQVVLGINVELLISTVWKILRPSNLIANSSDKLSGFGSTFVFQPLMWHS